MPKARKTPGKKSLTKSTRSVVSRVSKAATKPTANERAQMYTKVLGARIREPKVFVPVIILVLLVLLFLFRSAFVVALVNGQPISRSEFNKQLEAQAGKQVMNSLVTEKLIQQEADRQHITVNQSELDAQVKSIQNQLAKQGQTLDTALAAQGMTRDDFMTQLRLQALVKKMLANKIKVSDDEVNSYIDKNKDALPQDTNPDQLKAQVRQQLEQQKLTQAAQTLIQQLQQKAKITYF